VSRQKPTNVAASVRQRLLDLARARGEEFQLILIRYGVERLLYRLSRSQHQPDFILKGAMLFQVWTGQPHRSTLDLDLLAQGDHTIARYEIDLPQYLRSADRDRRRPAVSA
jgi:predicted nucleotidyltransferase component of viral defense system